MALKASVLGAGPAGLYSALLLKKNHPDWQVEVFERNARGATYGWGVVFSDRTLTALREADFKSYDAIISNFVLWDAIDVHVKGDLVRCNGHAFAGIGRRHLLEILNQRCEDFGVRLHFEHTLHNLADFDDADLILAADGVNSTLREGQAEYFQPRIATGNARYIWFGTDKVYDAFTFVFKETEYGLFQAHAYPFDAHTSTFIVECHSDTWQRTGLGEADEAANLAFCQALFSDHLGNHQLLSNRSHWLLFPTLRTRRWSNGNVVLLGDAAHTAHFSIGSGTKLALDDAIALTEAFEKFDVVADAFRDYEMARMPRVNALQAAADESRRYFENVRRYHDFQPLQFAFHLLTRSGRITTDNLRTRDPYFVNQVERWFYSSALAEPEPIKIAPPSMFTPLTLGQTTITNRIVVQEAPGLVAHDGVPGDDHAAAYPKLVSSGAGMVLTGPLAISAQGRITPEDAGMYSEQACEAWQSIVGQARAQRPVLIVARLAHAGRRAATRPRRFGLDIPLRTGSWQVEAPSPVPYGPDSPIARELDTADLSRLRAEYVDAAHFVCQAGFDGLLIDMAHGYLLSSFLSPLTNRRGDENGGKLENRLRFPLEILALVRQQWPNERPLMVAMNGSDWQRGGLEIADAVEIAQALKERGCDLIVVEAGQSSISAQPDYDPGTLARYSDIIRTEAGIPTLATGYMTISDQPNTLLAGGRADLCLFHPPV